MQNSRLTAQSAYFTCKESRSFSLVFGLMIDIEGGVVDSVTETRGQFVHSKKPDSLLPVSVMAACIEDI